MGRAVGGRGISSTSPAGEAEAPAPGLRSPPRVALRRLRSTRGYRRTTHKGFRRAAPCNPVRGDSFVAPGGVLGTRGGGAIRDRGGAANYRTRTLPGRRPGNLVDFPRAAAFNPC